MIRLNANVYIHLHFATGRIREICEMHVCKMKHTNPGQTAIGISAIALFRLLEAETCTNVITVVVMCHSVKPCFRTISNVYRGQSHYTIFSKANNSNCLVIEKHRFGFSHLKFNNVIYQCNGTCPISSITRIDTTTVYLHFSVLQPINLIAVI